MCTKISAAVKIIENDFFFHLIKVGVLWFTQGTTVKTVTRTWFTDLSLGGDGLFGKHAMMVTAESMNNNPLMIAGSE